MLRRLLLSAAAMVALPVAAMLPACAADAATTAACTDGVAVAQFAFNPPSVAPGSTSALTLVLQNCTSQTIQGSTIWFGQYIGSSGQICLVIDPLPPFPYTIAPGGTYILTNSYEGISVSSCQPTALKITANVNENGVTGTAATATANLAITQPATGGCHVTYTPNNWQGGFTANVTIANNGSTAINGWTLTFSFPGDQKITNAWNAAVTQTGTSVTAANMSYNSAIPAGGSQSLGFQGTWTANDTSPTAFSVNGMACT
jgi:hypothetical protein